ncbi:heterokaryon incompatibility protein-domain-containing protein [Diaporthe sp. PMI_573]|nr:heterokaryon incompatibility protein-domain-containing protein [Diaporthaceae sp. PMI_573]
MAKPSSSQLRVNGLPNAAKSTVSSQKVTLESMKQQREELSSSDEPSKQTPELEPSVQSNQIFDEKADQTNQSGHNEQFNEMVGSDDEASRETSDPGHLFRPSQLPPAYKDTGQPVQDEELNENFGKDEIESLDANFTEEVVTEDGTEIQEATNSLPLIWDLKYNYRPLSRPDSTRVLVLLPAQKTVDDLRCYMDEVRLSDVEDKNQGFTALSYVWGADKAFHLIWFENHSLRIRPNLDSALRNLRRRDRSIRLWVDAVCIDQSNLLERNHQVQQMRDIFSAASETVIYLGPQDGGNTGLSAWNFLERHSSWALDENRDVDRKVAARLDEHLIYFRGEIKDVELDVLSRSWFRRLWVFQEAVVSRSLSIQCGNRRISWDDFCRILLLLPRIHDQYGFSLQDNHKLDIVRNIHISRRDYLRQRGLERFLPSWQLHKTSGPSQGDMDILSMLSRARYLEASDARDKIYGLVGISTGINAADSRFAIDYRLSVREVYVKFARNHIEATKSYDIFSYVDAATESLIDFKSSQRPPLLPSWVPNWHYQEYISHGSNRTILETLPMETPTENKARQNRVADGYYSLSSHQYVKTMVVLGRIIGRIERYTLPLRLLGMTEVLFQDARNSIKDKCQRFTSIMEMWKNNLYFDGLTLRPQEREVPLKSPAGGEISAVVSPPRARAFASHFREGRMRVHTSVEYHLYKRARQTAGWSDGTNKASYVITDKESVVDGKRLAICAMETEGVRQLALVPSMAHELDFVIQISGCRVPFVVKATPGVAWPGETVDLSKYSGTLKQTTTCQIVGECLLNDFEELPKDKMDTMFIIV